MNDLCPMLEYVDQYHPPVKVLCGEYGKTLVSQAVDKGLLSVRNKKRCELTPSGVTALHGAPTMSQADLSDLLNKIEQESEDYHTTASESTMSSSSSEPPKPTRSLFGVFGALAGLFVSVPTILMYADELKMLADIETYEDLIYHSVTVIGLFLKVPARLSLALACLFQWIGFCTARRNFLLASGILYFCATFLWPADGFLAVIPLILAFIAYARTKVRKQ